MLYWNWHINWTVFTPQKTPISYSFQYLFKCDYCISKTCVSEPQTELTNIQQDIYGLWQPEQFAHLTAIQKCKQNFGQIYSKSDFSYIFFHLKHFLIMSEHASLLLKVVTNN